MIKNKPTDNILVILLSLIFMAYSTVLQFSTPSIVLCFGDDGHIAFEQSGENYQCIDIVDNTIPVNTHSDLSGQKDDCRDVPLQSILSSLYLEKDGKPKNVKLEVLGTNIKTIKAYPLSHLNIIKDSTIIHTSMKNLQSTILLI